MGSWGARRRKAVQHLPKVSSRDLPTENELIPPNIMWPAKGSGFEADPFSPAGTQQRQWWMIQRLASGRRTRWIIWLSLAFMLVSVGGYAVHVLIEVAK